MLNAGSDSQPWEYRSRIHTHANICIIFLYSFKARVCNVVQKHILLYRVKWSCYPESSQYIMYSEKGMKIIGPLWQLVRLRKIWPISAIQPGQHGLVRCMDWSDAFMSRPQSLPPPRVHVTFHWCQKHSAHSSAEIGSCRRSRSFGYNGRENAASVTCNSSPC